MAELVPVFAGAPAVATAACLERERVSTAPPPFKACVSGTPTRPGVRPGGARRAPATRPPCGTADLARLPGAGRGGRRDRRSSDGGAARESATTALEGGSSLGASRCRSGGSVGRDPTRADAGSQGGRVVRPEPSPEGRRAKCCRRGPRHERRSSDNGSDGTSHYDIVSGNGRPNPSPFYTSIVGARLSVSTPMGPRQALRHIARSP